MTNYANGAAAERQVIRGLKGAGYRAMRSAGSHGPIDVVAWNGNGIRLIQVKKDVAITPAERRELQNMAAPFNASVEIWRRRGAGRARRWDVQVWNETTAAWEEGAAW